MQLSLASSGEVSRTNLRRLILIRAIVIAGQLFGVWFALQILGLALPWVALLAVILSLGAINLAALLRLRSTRPISELEYAGQLIVDILWLSLALFLSGGAANPFVSYYLVPLSISAAVLPWRYTWFVAGLSLCAYTAMLFFHLPLPAVSPHSSHNALGAINLHVLGMWGNFLISAALITWFVVRMAATVRLQEAELNRRREDALRDEQIMAVATLAAGTAHELGTPLSTMRILLDEMRLDMAEDEAARTDIELLLNQTTRCKTILERLVATAEQRRGAQREQLPLADFVERTLSHWQVLRPQADYEWQAPVNSPVMGVDSTLEQALVNLLDNGHEASEAPLCVTLEWDRECCIIRIRDRGPGIAARYRAPRPGQASSSHGPGRGLGLMLARATVERFGGNLELAAPEGGGTIATVSLPLTFPVDD